MKLISIALSLSLCMTPIFVSAQDTLPDEEEGSSLIEKGARLFMRGMMDELGPALEELEGLAEEMEPGMRAFVQSMGPALRDLMVEVEDWSAYDAPEILPNGDILIRRKPDADPLDPPTDDRPLKDGEIDL